MKIKKINILKWLFLFQFLFLYSVSFSQTFFLGDFEYRVENSKWYCYSNGERGDEIVPNVLIVRLSNRGNINDFSFESIGIENIKILSNRLFGDFFAIEIGESENPFEIAEILYQKMVLLK
ncbi:MAG: hypothetical protein ISS00_03965 [Candidatus Marinimicrobia bacterium]|nr:hypothetical protein [Candidatus Neomarinimicrobiota bacterium]